MNVHINLRCCMYFQMKLFAMLRYDANYNAWSGFNFLRCHSGDWTTLGQFRKEWCKQKSSIILTFYFHKSLLFECLQSHSWHLILIYHVIKREEISLTHFACFFDTSGHALSSSIFIIRWWWAVIFVCKLSPGSVMFSVIFCMQW